MAEATLKVVAKLAGVAPITVSCVVNGSENVAAATKEKILAIIRDLDYTPNVYAANLRRKRLNNEGPNGSSEGLVLSNKRLSAGCNAMQTSHAHQTSPEERRTLAQEIIRLRKDLDKLMRHTESMQTCMDARPAGLWDLYQDELQVAVSEAPLHSVSTLSSSLMGSRYSTKTSRD